MSVILAILAVLLMAGAFILLFKKEMLGPVAAFLAMSAVYFSGLLPMNANMLITWLCLTLIVTGVSAMQSPAVMAQTRGMGYITIGAIAGMVVGLLGFSVSETLGTVYAMMSIGVLAGCFFGYFLFTRTPNGRQLSYSRSRFFAYLLAKGFPVAISVMQLGVISILWIAITKY